MLLSISIIILSVIIAGYMILTNRKVGGFLRQLEDERKTVRELAVLNDIASLINKDLEEKSIIETIVDKSKELIKSEISALLLIEKGKVTGFYTSIGEASQCKTEPAGIISRVIKEGIPIRSNNIRELEGFKGFLENQQVDIKSILIVPVLLRDEIVGELTLANRIGSEEFSFKDEDLLLTLGFHAAFAIEKARLHREVTRLATIDGLTGLNNHRTFQEKLEAEIERSKRFNHSLSLLMLDIDSFKKFNDTYGHRIGDEVLKIVSCMIAENIRNVDFAARYGGEEFVIILPETFLNGAMITGEKIRQAIMNFRKKVDAWTEISVTVSIGAASYPEDATDRENLIEKADQALYSAKKLGRNKVCAFRDMPREY